MSRVKVAPVAEVTPVNLTLDPGRPGRQAEELTEALGGMVIGQPQAVKKTVQVYQMQATGLSPEGHPLATFLLLGPTGTGKTHLVESLAELIYGDRKAVVKIDCAEFQHSHEIAKIIGSPPGYLGHRETQPILSQPVLDAFHTDRTQVSLVLFDEIEKASDALWNLLLGIMDKAILTLGDNRRVDFSKTIIFMTSNLGSKEIAEALAPSLGFAPKFVTANAAEGRGLAAVRKKFTPEFINRIDHTVVFEPLTPEHLDKILDLEVKNLQRRIRRAYQLTKVPLFIIDIAPAARAQIISEGLDPRYGARYLKRTLEQKIMHPVVNLLTSDQIQPGDTIFIDLVEGSLTFTRIPPIILLPE